MNRFPLLLVIFSCVVIHSCKKDVITYYTTGIKLEDYDNSGPFAVPAGNTVQSDSYIIRVNYKSDQTAFNGVNDNNTYSPGNLPTSILIYALQPFDSLHPAGSSLNSYFIAGPGLTSTAEDIINEFADTQDFYPTHDPDDLWLMKAPAANGTYSFVVRLNFDDGAIVSDTTSIILN